MVRSFDDALELVAGFVENNNQTNRQANLQRRNGVTDLYGITETKTAKSGVCKFYMSVSPDMTYLSRFSFKLDLTITASTNIYIELDGVNITPYVLDKISLPITSSGIYPSSTLENDFDILKVAGDLKLIGRTEDSNKLVAQGLKKLVISGDGLSEATLISYIKYSNLNR